ncbi:MAG: hypothetical protein O2894_09830 [Planctomycetota bacterium]|nr:hypothetical protein [Planctomycetota bacterium]
MRATQRLRRWAPLERLAVHAAVGAIHVIAALPARWVLTAADALGSLLSVLDRRGLRAARANLNIVFGDTKTTLEKLRIHRRSYRHTVRALFLLLHLQPLTPKRFGRWVEVDPAMRDAWQTRLLRERGGVLVSGHIGNWELMLGLRVLFQDFPPTVFLAEQIPHGAINDVLKRLRSHGDVVAAFRKGGARAVIAAVAAGGTAALLVDRNVRRQLGGVFAPFMGLEARTSPLPAWIALRHHVPVFPIFCLPTDGGRYRLWLGPDLTTDLPEGDEVARTRELLTRMNAVFEDIIRARPELWNWTLKRWKSRPTVELGRYPAYSLHDPDRA